MKKTLKTGKKALSVFMAALMVLTAWVFFAPEKAEAATAGKYTIKVVVTCTNGFSNKDTYWELNYSTNNGTTSGGYDRGDIGKKSSIFKTTWNGTDGNTVTTLFEKSYPGFPTYFHIKGYKSTPTGDGKFKIDVYVNGQWVGNGSTSFSGNVHFDCGVNNISNYPSVNSISWNNSAATTYVPKDTTKTNTVSTSSATVYDQYGVEWYQEPYYALNTEKAAKTSNDVRIKGVSLSTYGMADTTTLQVTNAAKDWVAKGGTARDVYINAFLNGKTSSVKKVTINNFTLTAKFYSSEDKNASLLHEQTGIYYNSTVLKYAGKTSPTKAADDTYHYNFKGWKKKGTETNETLELDKTTIIEDTELVPVFEAVKHSWEVVSGRTEPTCNDNGGYKGRCTVCGKSDVWVVLPATGHKWEHKKHVAPTCTEDGYDLYECTNAGCTETKKEAYDGNGKLGHNWGEWKEVTPATCTEAGEEKHTCLREGCLASETQRIKANGHEWKEEPVPGKAPTCTEGGYVRYKCTACNKFNATKGGEQGELISALGHDWNYDESDKSWEVVTPATCETAGVEKRTCKRDSSHTETRVIAKLGHEYDRNITNTEPATCTKDGYTYHPCKHKGCNSYTVVDTIPKLNHQDDGKGEWVITIEATCEKDGLKKYRCSLCGNFVESKNQTITKLGHKWGTYTKTKEATCTENAKQTAHCLNKGCTETNTIDIPNTKTGHRFETYFSQNDATCLRDGTKIAQCENYYTDGEGNRVRCSEKDIKTDEGTKLAHVFRNYKETKAPTCEEAGEETAVCELGCKTTATRPGRAALGHKVTDWKHDKDSETCCAYGTKHGKCTREGCTETVTGVEDKDFGYAPHSYLKKDGTYTTDATDSEISYTFNNDATCIADGTESASCANAGRYDDGKNWKCGNHIDRTAEGTKHPHTFPNEVTEQDLYISNNDGTCLRDGTMYALCKECETAKRTVTEPDSKKDHFVANWISDGNATCTEDGTKHGECVYGCGTKFENVPDVGSALGHWFRDYKESKAATCTENRERTATCERKGCNATETVTDKNTALGHDWSDWAFVGEKADCIKGGTMERHCKRACCIGEDGKSTVTETKTVDKTEHTWTWVTVKEEGKKTDCTTGYKKHQVCSVCKAVRDGSEVEVPGGAHHFVLVVDKAATCTEAGQRKVACDVCGAVESDVTIPKTGHLNTYLDESTVIAATCKDKGYSGDIKCTLCDAVVEEGRETDVTNEHVFTEYFPVTAATCTKNATEKATCSVCGNAENTREVPGSALGHDWSGEWTQGKAPTCTEDGTKVVSCQREGCDAEKTMRNPGSALGHKWGEWKTITEPTCTAPGKAEKSCEREGCTVKVEKQLRQLSHTPGEWIIDKEATCTEEGERHRNCVGGCGHEFDREVIPKLDHKFVVEIHGVTCIDDGYSTYVCSECKAEKQGEIVKALGHDWSGEWVVTKEPTCTKKGTETLTCTRCDKTQTRSIDALGHHEVIDPAVEATCTEPGLSEGSHCDRCGEILKEQETVIKPHRDADEDGKCDECGKEIKHSTDLNCNCICHKRFWLMRILYKVLLVFWKLFRIGKGCSCGAVHY